MSRARACTDFPFRDRSQGDDRQALPLNVLWAHRGRIQIEEGVVVDDREVGSGRKGEGRGRAKSTGDVSAMGGAAGS